MAWIARSIALATVSGLALVAPSAIAQELLANGSFDEDLAGWQQQIFDTSTIAWSSFDAAGSAVSGSVRFEEDGTVGPNSVRLRQCVAVEPGGSYDLAGSYFIPTQPVPGSATLAITWKSGVDCTGDLVGDQPRELPSAPMDVWTRLEMPDLEAPPEASSAELLVGAAFADETGAFEVFWDDLTLLPEPRAGLAALAAGLAVAGLARARRQPRGSRVRRDGRAPAAGGIP